MHCQTIISYIPFRSAITMLSPSNLYLIAPQKHCDCKNSKYILYEYHNINPSTTIAEHLHSSSIKINNVKNIG